MCVCVFVCVSERRKKQSQVVNRCMHKGDREGEHMGDIVVQNVRVFPRRRVRRADRRWERARDDKGTERRRGEMEG